MLTGSLSRESKMDFSKGFSARYTGRYIDPDTWQDLGTFKIKEGSITRDSSSNLLESAEIITSESLGESWVRFYLTAIQSGESVTIPLFTGLTSCPRREINGNSEKYKVQCYSVLKVADDVLLPIGYYAPAGIEGIKIIGQLFGRLKIKAQIPGTSPRLKNDIVAESGESYLSFIRKILESIGWIMSIDGYGSISVGQKQNDPVAYYSGRIKDVIELEITDTKDWYSCPNCLRVTCGSSTAIYKDMDIDDRLSIPGRRREIWASETAQISTSESLGEYVIRRLKELQSPAREISYKRRFDPETYPGRAVMIDYPKHGISGKFCEKTQKITMSYGCTTEVTAYELD
jgi:hypothetical protein